MIALSVYWKQLTFGKYKGKTIEEVHFIDYGWLNWAMKQPTFYWIKDYVEHLPNIYPKKIKVRCGENHHDGCKKRIATRVTLPIDHRGNVWVHFNQAYYWCSKCDIYSEIPSSGLTHLNLEFSSVLSIRRRIAIKGFHQILRKAYGINRLTPQKAYEIFWK